MRKVMGPVSPGPRNRCGQFKPGQSGNPAGRPRGARSRLNEAFLNDMMADWQVHGAATIKLFRTERPHEYVKVFAGMLPREIDMSVSDGFEDMSDEELQDHLTELLREQKAEGKYMFWEENPVALEGPVASSDSGVA